MRSVPIREAKAKFSELVDAVERGEQVTITRHGEPAAVLVSLEDAKKLQPRPLLCRLLVRSNIYCYASHQGLTFVIEEPELH